MVGIIVDNNLEAYESKLIYPVLTELYIPKTEEVVPVSFDGLHLAINGIVEYTHRNKDGAYVRLILQKTLANPDAEVANDVILPGTIPKAKTIKNAVDIINFVFNKTEVKPLQVAFEPKAHPYDVPKVDYVKFRTGTEESILDTSRADKNNRIVHPKKLYQLRNEAWLQTILSEQTDLLDVPFEKMSPKELAITRLLHKRTGTETAVLDIKTLLEEDIEERMDTEEFMRILTFWAQKYSAIEPLKKRITMRKIIDKQQPSAAFSWNRPKFS